MDYKRIKKGNKIRIISWPRIGDGADGFAGIIGTVKEINYNERFGFNHIGSIIINTENGGTLVGVGVNRMKFEILI